MPWLVGWGFVLSGFGMCFLALFNGLMSGPGPRLEGALRQAHPLMHWSMYVILAAAAGITLLALLNLATFGIAPKEVNLALIGIASLHGIFHLWRHPALGAGAFRRMTPKALHGLL